jgi:EmrB/QacA subfamily drug resistance transporter
MEHSKAYQNSVLFIICMATVLVPFSGSAINLALPMIGKEFSLNAISLSWVVSITLLSSAIFPVPFSRLADMTGRKRIFTIGALVFTVSTFFCAIATTGFLLIVARLFQGIGAAMMFATNMAIVTSVFPPNQRGKALGVITAVVYISISSGPVVGGMLAHYFGWRSIFYVTAAIGVMVILGIFTVLKGEWIESKGEKFDWIGVLLYGAGLSALIYGFSSLPTITGFFLIFAGIAALAGFVFYEKDRKFPVLNVRLFWENKMFGLASTAALINYAATFAISFLLSLYLQYIKGLSVQHAGLVLIAQPVAQAILSPVTGRWSDKTDARVLATTGMGVLVVGLLLMLFLTQSTPIWAIVAISLLLGIGFGIFSSPNMNVIMGSVEKKYLGLASATTNTMRLTGQAFSMGITMMVISMCVGNVKISPSVFPQFMRSIHITFIILAILCTVGVYTSWSGTKIIKPAAHH